MMTQNPPSMLPFFSARLIFFLECVALVLKECESYAEECDAAVFVGFAFCTGRAVPVLLQI